MPFKVLADIVILVHLAWILFLVFGGLWGRRYRAARLVHISALAFALIINLFGFYCPLTYVEVWLREKQSPGAAYAGSFIAHYLERLIYLPLPQSGLLGLTVVLCGFNVWIYLGKRRRVGK